MSAPIGNQFWKLRSKHGRDKLFASPELLWTAACEYFEWCVNNPWQKAEQIKNPKPIKDEEGNIISMETVTFLPNARPFTMQGLCLYLNCNTAYFRTFKQQLRQDDENGKDFNTVIIRIEETVYQQKFEGAAVGAFNPNLIIRDLGLADKTENSNENTHHASSELLTEIAKRMNERAKPKE